MAERIGLEAIRELMRRYLDEDGEKRSVTVEGSSIEEALKNASVELDSPIARLEYDIMEQGRSGLIGLGKKPWKITAYEVLSKKKLETPEEEFTPEGFGMAQVAQELPKDVDGEVFVRLALEGALLKVKPPLGRGKKANDKTAFEKLQYRAVHDYEESLVKETVKAARNEWVRVGSFISNPAADALMTVDITGQEMEVYVNLTPPQPGGSDLSKDIILSYLRSNKVVFGVLDEAVQSLEDKPVYKVPVLVAQGQKLANGEDAYIQYLFETDRSKIKLEEKNGKVDYKELNLVQNVVEGQALAKKIPATQGVPGRTVTGKILAARNGKDIALPLGKNVKASEDGLTIIATVNGEATYINGKINVETVFTINGNIDLKTGNQFFLGTIIVNGSVEDGFELKATGNIEIRGNVGRATLEAEGDIVIHQGIAGKGQGKITAGKNLWAKFIENSNISVGENVIVTQNIINSNITAEKRIIAVGGKHSAIIGGIYRACEEINAKTIGSASGGAETILEVGSDPKSRAKLEELDAKIKAISRQVEELDKNINTLNETKRQKKSLPEDKEAILEEMEHRRAEIVTEMDDLKAEYDSINSYLANLKVRGKVSVSGKIFPGSKIVIRDIREDIKNEYRGLTFYLENMMIKTTKYEEIDENLLKKGPPDAY